MNIDTQSQVAVTLGRKQYVSIDKKNNLRLHQVFEINGAENNLHIDLGPSQEAIRTLKDALTRLEVHAK